MSGRYSEWFTIAESEEMEANDENEFVVQEANVLKGPLS
jgi:hypothetical protein